MTEIKQDRFMFFANFAEAIQELPEEEHADAYKAICEYGIYGILPKNKTLKGMCIMSMPSLFKKEKRGGNHNPTGKNQHSDGEVKEVKTGQSGQSFLKQKLETETETETENLCETETDNEKEKFVGPEKVQKLLESMSVRSKSNKNKIFVSDSLSLVELEDDDFPVHLYLEEYGEKVIKDVQNWLVNNKNGQSVDKAFICRQFNNFAQRQRK